MPVHKAVPVAVKQDSSLYELLALVDAIRGGRAREKEAARKEIWKMLEHMNRPGNPNLQILALAIDQPGDLTNSQIILIIVTHCR